MSSNISQQSTMDFLGVEATSEDESYTNVSNMNQFKAHDLEVGATFSGKPEASIFRNDEKDDKGDFIKNYDAVRVRLIDNPDYLDAYFNIPKPDENGIISNIRKGSDFFRSCFDMIYSFMRYIDETNIIDPKTGEEIQKIKKINIENFVDLLNDKERIELEITEGNPDSEYNSFMIRKMYDEI